MASPLQALKTSLALGMSLRVPSSSVSKRRKDILGPRPRISEGFPNYSGARNSPVEEVKAILGVLFDAIVNDRKMQELHRLLLAEPTRVPELVDHYSENFAEPVFSKINTMSEDGVVKKMFSSKAPQIARVVMILPAGAIVS
jgi:hypothetical protein